MHSVCRTQLKRIILRVAAGVLVLLVVLGGVLYLRTRPVELLDEGAISGEPVALDAKFGYSQISPQGICTIRLCATPVVEKKDVYFYLTNLPTNQHLMRAELYEAVPDGEGGYAPGKLLGETGFIEPGTYLECLTMDKTLKKQENPVFLKIALRNGETGQSEGFFYLNMTLPKS